MMLFRLFTAVCLVASMSFVSQLAHAQKVANYDFTDAKPLERLRPPVPTSPLQHPATRDRLHPPLPPRPIPEESGEGACSGILASPPLEVSILSLDRASYAFGDEFTFVLRVKAIYPTRVPIRASMVEIEPSDPNVSYEWRSLGLSIELRSSTHQTVGVGLLQLYGSKDIPGSEIDLKAREWIELRGKARMKWANFPRGTLPASEEKYVLRLPLKSAQEFDARAVAMRAQGYRYDAASRKESRVCHPAEQSFGVDPVHITITPSSKS
jgi:hypothetical protein